VADSGRARFLIPREQGAGTLSDARIAGPSGEAGVPRESEPFNGDTSAAGPVEPADAPAESAATRDFAFDTAPADGEPHTSLTGAEPATTPLEAEAASAATSLWPEETAGTAEAAIVAEATSPLVAGQLNVWKDELFAWFRTLLSAAVYATLIVTFGFQVARVEGQSMAPTLADQDRLIVNKLAYRLGPPRRGDIVMLYYPSDPDKSFVKRVIAEEGDTVKIEDGRVYVNNVPMDDSYVPAEYRSHDDHPAKQIQAGYYYVMGDHRNNSSDSRHWGEVPKKYITGRVQLRWWPIPNARIFWNP
jgi:signal peptidase I